MPKYYVTWQMNPLETPKSPEERVKLWLSLLEMIKADMAAGCVKDWGMAAGLEGGYAIREEASETDLTAALLKWTPYVNFEAKPILTVDQTIEAIQKAVTAMKK